MLSDEQISELAFSCFRYTLVTKTGGEMQITTPDAVEEIIRRAIIENDKQVSLPDSRMGR